MKGKIKSKGSSRLKSIQDLSFRLGIQIKVQLEERFRTATFIIDTLIYEALYNYKPGMVEVGGQGGRAWRRTALLVAHSDFQTLRHPCKLVPIFVRPSILL